jgi:hypothetical protein
MKKAVLIIEAVLLMFTLASCSSLRRGLIDEQAESEKVAQQVIAAIENRDQQVLVRLFSINGIDEADGFEEGASYTFNLYEGDCLGIEKGYCIVSKHYGYPGDRAWVDAQYKVTTTKGVYWLYFEYVLFDDADSRAEGIYYLSLNDDKTVQEINQKAQNTGDYSTTGLPYHAGIYHPGWDVYATKKL